MSKRIISYSLFGDSELYILGLIENIFLTPFIYPDFQILVYCAEDCPALPVLKTLNCDIVIMPPQKGIDRTNEEWKWQIENCAMFWRNFIIDELEEGDVALFRDADSRISKREADPVYEWIDSPYLASRFAENKYHHNSFLMGGMWQIKGGYLNGVKDSIIEWIDIYKNMNHPYIFVDLEYYSQVLQPILKDKTIGYGYGMEKSLPDLREGENPIGWVEDEYLREKKFNPEGYI